MAAAFPKQQPGVNYGINSSHPLEFMPAIEPGKCFERVRCLRPNAAMMDKISLRTLGHLEAGDPAQLGELMAWPGSTPTSTCGAGAAARGRPTSTRSHVTSTPHETPWRSSTRPWFPSAVGHGTKRTDRRYERIRAFASVRWRAVGE